MKQDTENVQHKKTTKESMNSWCSRKFLDRKLQKDIGQNGITSAHIVDVSAQLEEKKQQEQRDQKNIQDLTLKVDMILEKMQMSNLPQHTSNPNPDNLEERIQAAVAVATAQMNADNDKKFKALQKQVDEQVKVNAVLYVTLKVKVQS